MATHWVTALGPDVIFAGSAVNYLASLDITYLLTICYDIFTVAVGMRMQHIIQPVRISCVCEDCGMAGNRLRPSIP